MPPRCVERPALAVHCYFRHAKAILSRGVNAYMDSLHDQPDASRPACLSKSSHSSAIAICFNRLKPPSFRAAATNDVLQRPGRRCWNSVETLAHISIMTRYDAGGPVLPSQTADVRQVIRPLFGPHAIQSGVRLRMDAASHRQYDFVA